MIQYDEDKLKRSLGRLSAQSRVIFAAACTERQFPAYHRYSEQRGLGNSDLIRNALDSIWDEAEEKSVTLDLEAELKRCEALIRNEQDDDSDELPYAEWSYEIGYAGNALASMIYTLGTRLNDDFQDVIWAARCSYEAISDFAGVLLTTNPFEWAASEVIDGHPLVQAELARQQRDLSELHSAGDPARTVVATIRERARRDSDGFFGSASCRRRKREIQDSYEDWVGKVRSD